MNKLIIAYIVGAALVGCAITPVEKPTASGKAEGFIRDGTVDEARSRFMNSCMNAGSNVEHAEMNQMECVWEVKGVRGILAQAFVGNAYSTPAMNHVRWTFFQVKGGVKVVGDSWVESQMAFGQVHRMPYTGANAQNQLQAVIDRNCAAPGINTVWDTSGDPGSATPAQSLTRLDGAHP